DDIGPALYFTLDMGIECLRCAAVDAVADVLKLCSRFGVLDGSYKSLVQLLYGFGRRARRGQYPVPAAYLEPVHGLADSGQVGQQARTFFACNRQGFELAGPNLWQRGRDAVEHQG